jgi:ABC-type glycerol-3-phosphate transport system substrate-binding protein
MKLNAHLVGYRSDYLNEAGYDGFPKTWDDVDKMMVKLKPVVEKNKATGVGISRDLFRTLGTSFTTVIDKPFDEQGIWKMDSPEWIQLIEMYKKWKDMGMARIDGPEHNDVWQKGGFAFSLGSHSLVRLGRQVWGTAKVNGAVPPQANASQPPRTWIHVDHGMVFNNAPDPQLAADWLLSILGPEGAPADRWWSGVVKFSGQPSTQAQVDKALKNDASLKEVYDLMQIVPNSYINSIQVAGGYAIVQSKMWPHLDKFFNGEQSAKDAMAAAKKDVMDEVAKQKA